ncbi:MAG: hypothetical protein JXA22_02320 [Candidatus Thermoplasmatota archaeon]|nr:hypothetical protein [Candidatus Thermoplasmatota archaeon]
MSLNCELILLSHHFSKNNRIRYDMKEDVSAAIGIEPSTYEHHMIELIKMGLIERSREHNEKYVGLTENGMKRMKDIIEELKGKYFTALDHSIPYDVPVFDIIERIKDPLHRLFLVSLFKKRRKFDLIDTIESFSIIDRETSIHRLVTEYEFFDTSDKYHPINDFMKLSFHRFSRNRKDPQMDIDEFPEGSVVHADVCLRSGRVQVAQEIYERILNNKDITRDLWFISNAGLIRSLFRTNRSSEAISLITELEKRIDDKLPLAYLKLLHADYLSTIGNFDEASSLFKSCIGTFSHFHCPELLALAYNNKGCHYYAMGDFVEAEKAWNKGRMHCQEAKCEYTKALLLTNLASISRYKSNHGSCKQKLKNASLLFEKHSILEGLSVVEYNRTLLYISMKDMDKAISHYRESIRVAYPLPPTHQVDERKKLLFREMERLKYTPDEILSFSRMIDNIEHSVHDHVPE